MADPKWDETAEDRNRREEEERESQSMRDWIAQQREGLEQARKEMDEFYSRTERIRGTEDGFNLRPRESAMEKLKRDVLRVVVFIAFGFGLVLWDESNMVVIQAFMIGTFLVLGSHVTRRLLFSHLNLQSIAREGTKTPMGAAVVFATICMFLVAVMWLSMSVLK